MGCNGSKQDVATSNSVYHRLLRKKSSTAGSSTLKTSGETEVKSINSLPKSVYHRLLRKKSDTTGSSTLKTSGETEVKSVKSIEKSETRSSDNGHECEKPLADVKDITVNTGEIAGAFEDSREAMDEHEVGKLIAPESPDQYFSPKKGEDHVETGDVFERHSRPADGGKREEGPSNVVELMEGGEEKRLVDEENVEARVEDDKNSTKKSEDLKEAFSVKEATKNLTTENKADHVGEVVEEKKREDSSSKDQVINNQLKKNGE